MTVKSKAKPKSKTATLPWERLLIGIFPGYAATILITTAFVNLLPISRANQMMWALLIAGLMYTALFIYVFAVETWVRAIRDMGIVCAVAAVALVFAKGVLGS